MKMRRLTWIVVGAAPLYAAGAAAIFPPGTVIAEAAIELIDKLKARLGHNSRNAAAG